jgi:hypothetical protein
MPVSAIIPEPTVENIASTDDGAQSDTSSGNNLASSLGNTSPAVTAKKAYNAGITQLGSRKRSKRKIMIRFLMPDSSQRVPRSMNRASERQIARSGASA